MGDILAIISKAQFEAMHGDAKVGDALGFEKYVSTHAALEPVRAGGSIFLVTVRPPDERLWLLAELVNPKHDGKVWTSKASTLVVKDITAAIPQLQFANGKGLAPKKGAMGMSLQTPRLLTQQDTALLRGKVVKQKSEKATPVLPERSRGGSVASPNSDSSRKPSTPLGQNGGGGVSMKSVLEEWRVTRAPELEKLIDTLSKHHARALPPLDPEAADFDDQWNARAADATPETLAHLLPGLWSDPRGAIPMRLRKLLDLGADPRLGAALLTMIDEPPLTASSNFSAWTMLFKALPSLVDTRASKRLKARAAKKGGDSKFWPRLTAWIEGALEDLSAPATLSKEQLASVAKRQKHAEALLKGPAPSGAVKQEKAVVALPMSGSPRESLERAVAEFSGGKPLGALEPLRLFWEVTREPAAAELMARIGKFAATTQPSFDGAGGKAAAIHPAWMKAGKRFDATLVTPLLDALTAGKLVDTEERLELMLTWPADPRVAEAMVGLIDPGHTRGTYIGARPQLWKRTYDLLVRNADPRFIEVLQKNATRLESAALFDRNRAERPHASRTIVPYVTESSKGRAPSADEAALLGKLSALVTASSAKTKASKLPGEELGLLQAILAAPDDDDTPRLVYADFLTERGDVRGEFINLSISLLRGGKVKSKLEAFAKQHRRAIDGALAGMSCAWERGLFDAVGFGYRAGALKEAEQRELVDDLRWVTVRKLTMPREETNLTGQALLAESPLFGLQELHDVTAAQLAVAAAREFPWAIRTIHLHDYALDATVKPTAFPKLQELWLAMWTPPRPAFWDAPLLQVVERLKMGGENLYGEFPIDELIVAAPRLAKLKAVEVRTSSLNLDVVKAGDGRVDATFTLTHFPSVRDDWFLKMVERLRRIPAAAVRRFTVVTTTKPREGVLELVNEATQHLARA